MHPVHPETQLKNVSIVLNVEMCEKSFCHKGSLLIYWEQMKFLFSVVLNFKPLYLIGKGHSNSTSLVSYYWMFMEYPALSRELTQWQGVIWSQEMLKEAIKMSSREGSNKDTFWCFHQCSLIWKDEFVKYSNFGGGGGLRFFVFHLIADNYFSKTKRQGRSGAKVSC